VVYLLQALKKCLTLYFKLVKNSYKIILPVVLNEACWALGNIAYVVA